LATNNNHSLTFNAEKKLVISDYNNNYFNFISILKESLNNDCQQFHQYQQNKEVPLLKLFRGKKEHIKTNENQAPCLGQAQKFAMVKPFNGIPTFSLIIIGPPTIIFIILLTETQEVVPYIRIVELT